MEEVSWEERVDMSVSWSGWVSFGIGREMVRGSGMFGTEVEVSCSRAVAAFARGLMGEVCR